GELHGLVAVALVRADAGHRARAGLEHGDALDGAVLEEDLGHAELLGEDRGHDMASVRPACARGRAGTSRPRTQGEACAGGTGEPEDDGPAKFMREIRACGGRKADISPRPRGPG